MAPASHSGKLMALKAKYECRIPMEHLYEQFVAGLDEGSHVGKMYIM